MRVARRYLLGGRVQGVGFRCFVHEVAKRDAIQGWVRNTPDGRVEIAAEGDADAMERFERKIRLGPASARVDRVDVEIVTPDAGTPDFSIR